MRRNLSVDRSVNGPYKSADIEVRSPVCRATVPAQVLLGQAAQPQPPADTCHAHTLLPRCCQCRGRGHLELHHCPLSLPVHALATRSHAPRPRPAAYCTQRQYPPPQQPDTAPGVPWNRHRPATVSRQRAAGHAASDEASNRNRNGTGATPAAVSWGRLTHVCADTCMHACRVPWMATRRALHPTARGARLAAGHRPQPRLKVEYQTPPQIPSPVCKILCKAFSHTLGRGGH